MEPIPALSPPPGQSSNFVHPVLLLHWEIVNLSFDYIYYFRPSHIYKKILIGNCEEKSHV